jgi:hypothetical protein
MKKAAKEGIKLKKHKVNSKNIVSKKYVNEINTEIFT